LRDLEAKTQDELAEDVGLGVTKYKMLCRIGVCERLVNSDPKILPSGYSVLYELAQIPEAFWDLAVEDGIISPKITRVGANSWRVRASGVDSVEGKFDSDGTRPVTTNAQKQSMDAIATTGETDDKVKTAGVEESSRPGKSKAKGSDAKQSRSAHAKVSTVPAVASLGMSAPSNETTETPLQVAQLTFSATEKLAPNVVEVVLEDFEDRRIIGVYFPVNLQLQGDLMEAVVQIVRRFKLVEHTRAGERLIAA